MAGELKKRGYGAFGCGEFVDGNIERERKL